MPKYTATIIKTSTYSAEVDLGEFDDEFDADTEADVVAAQLNSGERDAQWDWENDEFEIQSVDGE